MTVDVANPDLLSALSVVIKHYEHILIFICSIIDVAVIKPCRFAIAGSNVCCLSVCLAWMSWLREKKRDKCSFPYLLRNASMKRLQIDKNAAMLSAGQLPGKSWPFFCWTWTSQMSVSLPQLSEAIMTICSALFLVSRSMFSHETLDPSNQSLLCRACGPCLNHNFMSSTATAVWRLKF